jgi:hypothetical protein
VKQNLLQEYALSMSAKPATIYLGTRSHNCRRPGHPKRHQEGRYRNLIKGRSSFKKQAAGQGTEAAIQRYHNHQLSVKKVVKFTNQVGKSNLAKKLSGSSTPSDSNKEQQNQLENQKKMTTSVLHLPATPTTTPAIVAVTNLDTIGCPSGTTKLKQQQNTSSSSLSSSQNSTSTAKVVGSIPSVITNVKPGLPSPSSTSETSDYQRSTPSPNAGNEDQLRSLGTTEIDWSQNNHPCNEHRINGNSRDAKLQIQNNRQIISTNQNQQKLQNNNPRRKSTSSLIQNNSTSTTSMMLNSSSSGISVNVSNPNKCASENNREQTMISTNNSSNLVLQQLRVALKKLPEAKLNAKVSLKSPEAVKRRHSDCGLISNMFNSNGSLLPSDPEVSGVKKAKLYQQQPHNRRPLSASVHSKGQGKITAYLPEMKHFIALRKEKLDRVLNLAQAPPKLASSEQKHKKTTY